MLLLLRMRAVLHVRWREVSRARHMSHAVVSVSVCVCVCVADRNDVRVLTHPGYQRRLIVMMRVHAVGVRQRDEVGVRDDEGCMTEIMLYVLQIRPALHAWPCSTPFLNAHLSFMHMWAAPS